MEWWKDENGVYGWIQLCLTKSHCHNNMVLLHVILKRSICVNEVIKMSLTVLRINEDTQDFSKPWKQPLYTVLPTFSTLYLLFLPLFISSCETGSLRTWYARQAPCWGSPEPEEVLPNTFVPSWTGCLSQPYIISHKNLGFPSRLPTIFFFT